MSLYNGWDVDKFTVNCVFVRNRSLDTALCLNNVYMDTERPIENHDWGTVNDKTETRL